jgi:outer membrane autotransporter protein
VAAETIAGMHQYTIVDANHITGTFAGIDTLTSYFLRPGAGLNYDPTAVRLTVVPVPFNDPNLVRTDNQKSLGSALQQIAESGGTNVTTALQQLGTVDQVRSAYDQLSGRTVTALAPVTITSMTRNVDLVANRLRGSLGSFSDRLTLQGLPPAPGPDAVTGLSISPYDFAIGNGTPFLAGEPWGVWGKGYALYGDRESKSEVAGYGYTSYGTSLGLDYKLFESLRLGLTGGYADGYIHHWASADHSDVSSTHLGLYGSYEEPEWYLDSMLAYADLGYQTHRLVDLTGEQLEGNPSGSLLTGYIETGLIRPFGAQGRLRPLTSFQVSALHIGSFTESGGDAALHFGEQRFESYKGSLGAAVSYPLSERTNGGRTDLELQGRWLHEFGDTRAGVDAAFAQTPAVVFHVSDAPLARDSAILGAGLNTWFTRQTGLALDYLAELSVDNTVHLISLGLDHRW